MFMKTLHDQSDSDKRERVTRILVISAVLAPLLVGPWQVINAAPRYGFQQALPSRRLTRDVWVFLRLMPPVYFISILAGIWF